MNRNPPVTHLQRVIFNTRSSPRNIKVKKKKENLTSECSIIVRRRAERFCRKTENLFPRKLFRHQVSVTNHLFNTRRDVEMSSQLICSEINILGL